MQHNRFIHGIHGSSIKDGWDSTGAQIMLDANCLGWLVFTEIAGLGHANYCSYTELGFKVIVRLNHSYGDGTIPTPDKYDDFAQRCADFVRTTCGCGKFIIGNEPNCRVEWPSEQIITSELYAQCYTKCRNAIHAVNPDIQVIIAAIGPWNIESGDWLNYFESVLHLAGKIDGIALHCYSHGSDPELITSDEMMATMPDRYYHFLAYRQFMERIPGRLQNVPVYITETDQDIVWLDVNNGWVKEAYAEIDRWNRINEQQIRCLALYRWTHDRWEIKGKEGVIQDFRNAMAMNYEWREGGGDVGTWNELLRQDCEGDGTQFPAQGGNQHFQVIEGFTLHYRHKGAGDFPAPELKPKDKEAGQPEVYAGRYAQSGFYISATGQFALVSDPVSVEPGKPVRGEAMYMHVFGDHRAGGSRCGIVDGDGPFLGGPEWPKDGVDPFSDPAITWGEWQSTYGGLPDREWAKIESGEAVPTKSYVRLIVQFNADTASSGSNAHWDNFLLEQFSEGAPPEPPDGEIAAEIMQIAADLTVMGAEIVGYAQQLYGLAERVDNPCPEEAKTLAQDIQGKADQLVGVLGG